MISVCPPPGVPQSQVLSKVSGPRSFLRGYPSPRFFPRSLVPGSFQGVPQSQVLSKVFGPRSFLWGVPQSWPGRYPSPVLAGGGTPLLSWLVGSLVLGTLLPGQDWRKPPSQDRTAVERYTSCGFPQEDFLV